MTPMQSIEHLSPEQIAKLIDDAQKENDGLRQRATDAETRVALRDAVISILQSDVRQLELQLESIGAGGVIGKRITDDGTLDALRACERTYHQMMVSGTPDNCYAHDKAREQFWRVFGGEQ